MIDKSDSADARRLRWLLEGNGYFMEEEGLCGHTPCDEEEKDAARAKIDEEIASREVTISALRIDIFDCPPNEPPSAIVEREKPTTAIRHAWIPQTMGDQVWVLYDFPTEADRLTWEAGLSSLMMKWIDRTVIPYAIKYGWHIRNVNGFVKGS